MMRMKKKMNKRRRRRRRKRGQNDNSKIKLARYFSGTDDKNGNGLFILVVAKTAGT